MTKLIRPKGGSDCSPIERPLLLADCRGVISFPMSASTFDDHADISLPPPIAGLGNALPKYMPPDCLFLPEGGFSP